VTKVLELLAGPLGRWLAVLVLVAAAAAFGAAKMHAHDQIELDRVTAAYNRFVGGVAATGEAARKRAAEEAGKAKERKEQADAENRRSHDRDRAVIERLRADAAARDSRGGSVSAAPAGSRCPDGQTCFDTAEYQRALGEFDRRARQLADEGTSVATDLDTAARWAQGR
jgi:hypothetical protein